MNRRDLRGGFIFSGTEDSYEADGRKAVKAGSHRGVGGEEVADARSGERGFKGLDALAHEIAGSFQDGKSGVPLVQMTDLRPDTERPQQPPSTDP